MTKRRILVTAALPYANGHIHIGHLVEYIQTDIWVRFQKLCGHNCIYICADDTHGTPIMIRARQEGRSEEDLIAEMQQAHLSDFSGFDIEFDNYGSTNSPENRALCEEFWSALQNADLVKEQKVTQLYDPEVRMFLADRFVKGTCPNPKCRSVDQYGDSCDKCGWTYSPTDLIDPVSTVSGATPEVRSADHLFVDVEQMHGFLDEWTQSGDHLQREVANYLKGHFLGAPLHAWDISRPVPYFGFEIPDSPGNYWYVWFDAPIGYIASTLQWCNRCGEDFDDWWRNPETEVHHFIGKDITYFHTLFWPAMLKTAGFNLPTKIHIHGFLTTGGEKMSKTKGALVQAANYLKHLDSAYLRYYYASKLGPRLDDIYLSLDEFVSKVNSDLVGKVVNLASRSAKFLEGGQLADAYPDDDGLFQSAAAAGSSIAEAYEHCDYNSAMRQIMVLADKANKYFEDKAPWNLHKDTEKQAELKQVCTVSLNLFRQLAIYLAPVLPRLVMQTEQLLHVPITSWDESRTPLLGVRVAKFRHMMKRVEQKQVDAMIEDSKSPEAADATEFKDGLESLENEPLTGQQCTFQDFTKVDMRIARVIEAEDVKDSKKLLRLKLSLGGEETRNVFSGIKSVYEPKDLVGRLVVYCANLEPREMRFGISEGMVLASGTGKKGDIFILSPDKGAVPGERVH